MPKVINTQPTEEPLIIDEVKTHLRVEGSEDDVYIDSLIVAARNWVENSTNRSLITQTWDYYLDDFSLSIELPTSPVSSVSSVKYFDSNNVEQTLATSVYTVDLYSNVSKITLNNDQSYPSTYDKPNAVKITYISGYGNSGSVPQQIKQAMLMLIGHWFENREMTSQLSMVDVPMATDSLLSPYRVINF